MYRTILVPTDGSDTSRRALEHAVAIAERFGATVHLLGVVDPSRNPMLFGVDSAEELDDAVRSIVDEIAAVYEEGQIGIRGEVRRGRPHRAILRYADEEDVDLLVMGRTGEESLADALLGSTADRVVRYATVPVVLVPAANRRSD